MSTILAVFRRDGQPVNPDEIGPMLQVGRCSAINGQHVWHGGPVVLAHQHLWITPEENGENQPLVSHCGRFAISFDGRLDNRKELEESLKPPRYSELPISDARLVLSAYAEWGERCLPRILGDFAFIVWNHADRRLLIARDPLGVRQISYYCDNQLCVVASTIAPILEHPRIEARINDGKIAEYIVQYDQNQEESFFADVFFCPPAHYLVVTETVVEKRRYWLPDPERRIRYNDPQDYVNEFLDLFRHSVAARLRNHGEFGIFLSGGMDSTSVSAIAHETLANQGRLPEKGLKTYSVAFEDFPECDEQKYIRTMTQRYHFDSCIIRGDNKRLFGESHIPYFAPDYLDYVMSNPLFWPLTQKASQDSVRIILTGSFGDLLFSRQRFWAVDCVQEKKWQMLFDTANIQDARTQLRWAKAYTKNHAKRWIPGSMQRRIQDARYRDLLASEGVSSTLAESTDLGKRIRRNPLQNCYARFDDIEYMTALHWNYYIHTSCMMLSKTQELGLEVWDPYRDRRLVEYAFALPAYIHGMPGPSNNKWILREAMRSILPEEIRSRPRTSGFSAWSMAWFRGTEVRELVGLLDDSGAASHGYYEREWMAERLIAHQQHAVYDYSLWNTVCLELWLQTYGAGATAMDTPAHDST